MQTRKILSFSKEGEYSIGIKRKLYRIVSFRADLTELPLDQSLRVVIGAQVSPINRTPGIVESILLCSDTETPRDR